MLVTQVYKKDTDFLTNLAAALLGAACISMPFAAWFLGWV
jgi:hypothetical protein